MPDTIDEDGVITESNDAPLMTVDATTAIALARAEIDQLVTTAHAYPRSINRAAKAMLDLVMLDRESADECMYRLPVSGKAVLGPSIRFAEALKQAWGNCAAGARLTEINRKEQYVEAEGVFIDYETNVRTTFRTQRSIRGKNGRTYDQRMIVVTGSAACSIAMRESILKGVPKMIWRGAYAEVMRVIRGDVTTLVERRQQAVTAFAAYGVKPEQIFEALDVAGMQDIGLDDIVSLRAMYQAIKNGEATVEDYFSRQVASDVVKRPLDDHDGESESANKNSSAAADPKPQGEGAAAPKDSAKVVPPDQNAKSDAAASTDPARASDRPAAQPGAVAEGGAQSASAAEPAAGPAETQTPPKGAAQAEQLAVDQKQPARTFTEEEIAQAIEAGARCYRKGMAKRTNPYKEEAGELALRNGWILGFDQAKKSEAEDQ